MVTMTYQTQGLVPEHLHAFNKITQHHLALCKRINMGLGCLKRHD